MNGVIRRWELEIDLDIDASIDAQWDLDKRV